MEHTRTSKMRWVPRQKSGNPFMNRLMDIPVVKSACQTAQSTYQYMKNSNRLIGAVLQTTENCVGYVNHRAEPVKKALEKPVNSVSKIADHQLENLQKWFPVINTSPHDVVAYVKGVYERSGLKGCIQTVAAAPGYAIGKVQAVIVYTGDQFVGLLHGVQSIGTNCMTGILDISERVVDALIASPDGKQSICYSPASPIVGRIVCIMHKSADGVRYRVVAIYSVSKLYASNAINSVINIAHNATAAVTTSIHKAIAQLIRVRDAVLGAVSNGAHQITAKSAAAAVYLAKAITNGMADVSDRVVSIASPYLPEGMEKPVAALLSYIHHWQERIQNAASPEDIWKAAIDEAKQNARLAKQIIQTILNNDDTAIDARKKRW